MRMRELARKAAAIAASAAMALALVPAASASATGAAAGTATEGGFVYKVNSDDTATVTGYADKSATEVTVPGELGGHAVTCVDPWLLSQGKAEAVTLPPSLVCVGWVFGAANGTPDYKQSGFIDAGNLKAIALAGPSEYLAVVDGVLYTANMETLICYPGAGKEKDTTLSVPDGVVNFALNALNRAPYLVALSLPSSFRVVDHHNDTNGCHRLASISVASDNPTLSDSDGILYNKDKTALLAYPNGKQDKEFNTPASVTSFGNLALNGQNHVEKITIGSKVSNLGSSLTGCRKLRTIEVADGNQSFAVKDNILYNRSFDTLLAYPAGRSAQRFEIPSHVSAVGMWAFLFCKLSSLVVPATVKEMQRGCFHSPNIASIYAATSNQYNELLANEGEYVWLPTTNVYLSEAKTGVVEASVEKLPKAGKTVSVAASTGKVRITVLSVSAAKGDKKMSAMARRAKSYTGAVRVDYYPTGRDGRVNLKAVRLRGASGRFDVRLNVTEVAPGAFKNRRDVRDVALANVAKVGASAFSGCRNLRAASLGGGLASIGSGAFKGCRSLKSVRVASAKLKAGKVGSAAFKGTPRKMAVKAPKAKLGSYKRLLREAGASPSARFARI